MPPQQMVYEMLESPSDRKEREMTMISYLDPEPPRQTEPSMLQSLLELKDLVLHWLDHVRSRVELHGDAVDEAENRRRRDVLLFHGIEELEGENLESVLTDILRTKLEMTDFTVDSLKDCHRIGSVQPNGRSRSRPVLARFDTITLKALVWSKKRAFKGSNVIVTEFLTKTRQAVFMQARRLYGLKRCWTKDGVIYIMAPDATKHQLITQSDLDKFEQMYPPNGGNSSDTDESPEPNIESQEPGDDVSVVSDMSDASDTSDGSETSESDDEAAENV